MTNDTCTRCGKKHLSEFVYLELNNRTNHYATPGRVPPPDSQGLLRFGKTCARRALAHERMEDGRSSRGAAMAKMTGTVSIYTDTRCDAIARNLGPAVAEWADRNSAGWVLDRLADPQTAEAAAAAYVRLPGKWEIRASVVGLTPRQEFGILGQWEGT